MTFLAPALLFTGYVVVMLANPVRASFADGWRCLRRYPVLWRLPALLGFGHAVFHLVIRLVLHFRLAPEFVWARAGWHDPALWLSGSPDSLWWLPPPAVHAALRGGALPALEGLAGIFNNAVTTFPLAVIAAAGLFTNREQSARLLARALRRRLGVLAWPALGGVFLGALAVMAKAALYFILPAVANPLWFQWAPIIAAVAAAFEQFVGLGIQIYLILHAYAWVRGLSFEPGALRDVAVRRLGACTKWAGIVVLAGTVFIELPLVLKNFPAFASLFPDSAETIERRAAIARAGLAVALLCCASMQAWLALHGETLSRAWAAHWRLLRARGWEFAWFLIIAAIHLYAAQLLRGLILRGLGENTVPGQLWALAWPWLNGFTAGWCLAGWVCFFKRCER